MRRLAPLPAALLLSACVVGPNYRAPVPTAGVTAPFLSSDSPAISAEQPDPRWWRLFASPDLDALVQEALTANTDLRVAAANLAQARGVLQEARAGRFPTTDISFSANYNRFSQLGVTSFGSGAATGSTTGGTGTTGTTTGSTTGASGTGGTSAVSGAGVGDLSLYNASLDVSYEVDLFGRISRSIEAAKRDAQAQAAALDYTRTTVAAETARAFADACGYAQQIEAAKRNVAVEAQTYDLSVTLQRGGRYSGYEVAQAGAQLASSRAVLPQLEGQRRAALFRLAVLTGKPPRAVSPAADRCAAVPRIATPLPVGDGAALIRRRPDVRQAERTLAAQTARIGVQTAGLYPTITLGGNIGSSGTRPKDLVDSRGLSFSVGPALSWTFPNTLVARARIRQARAGADSALASFDGAILTALSDTEQALAIYTRELDRNAQLKIARDQATEAARLSRLRYTTGSDSFLTALVSEATAANAELTLAQSDALVAEDQVNLFKALGGGWEQAPPVVEVHAAR